MAGAALLVLPLAGCRSKDESQVPAAVATNQTPAQAATAASPAPTTTEVISAARNSLKAGNVDEAAAGLAELQLRRASFNAQQAKDYRQALSEVYDRVIEAAQRGDPKAQTALQLLRAAAPR
jgi:type IV pilus biogenesis protein CpaD/CtpE